MLKVDLEKCTGCGICLDACSVEAISLLAGNAIIDYEICNACSECVRACPIGAIISIEEQLPVEVMPSQSISVRQAQPAVLSPSQKITPWVGAMLTLVSREFLPRFADALVLSLEKHLERPARTLPDIYPRATREGLGIRRRQRRRAGRR
jgi:Fe-S-cluster-containing hydrogenase component 2